MMSLIALVMIAVAVLPAALAATATCTGALTAVEGVQDKCFWYAYQDKPMDIKYMNDLCHRGMATFGREGRLFRPKSLEELKRVEDTMLPSILYNLSPDDKGHYWADFFLYRQYGQSVWGTYTFPFELMAPGMWAQGEPNNYKGSNEFCTQGASRNYDADTYGLNDVSCDRLVQSVICEFPSEN